MLPFPVAPIMLAECMLTADGRIYRAVLAITFGYWLSGCRDLPKDTQALAALIRMPQSNYTPIKPAVDAALSELLPVLKAEYQRHKESQAMRLAQSRYANAVRHGKAYRRAQSANLPAVDYIPPPKPERIQPVTKPKYRGNGKTDMQARQASIDRETEPANHLRTYKPPRQPHNPPVQPVHTRALPTPDLVHHRAHHGERNETPNSFAAQGNVRQPPLASPRATIAPIDGLLSDARPSVRK